MVLDFQDTLKNEFATSMSDEAYRSMSKIDLESLISTMTTDYDLVLIDNEEMQQEQIGLLLMSIATHNLYVIDSRETPASHIIEVDLTREEYDIPKLSFVLNKYLFNPSVIKETYNLALTAKGRISLLISRRSQND